MTITETATDFAKFFVLFVILIGAVGLLTNGDPMVGILLLFGAILILGAYRRRQRAHRRAR